MKNLEKELLRLIIREEELKEFVDVSLASKEEYLLYVEQHKPLFIEFETIRKKINLIKWEMMTDEEKKEHSEYLTKLKEKFQ